MRKWVASLVAVAALFAAAAPAWAACTIARAPASASSTATNLETMTADQVMLTGGCIDGVTFGGNTLPGAYPASQSSGFTISTNFPNDGKNEVSFWNLKDNDTGFTWRQKTGASSQRVLGYLYPDSTETVFEVISPDGAHDLIMSSDNTVASIGNGQDVDIEFYRNSVLKGSIKSFGWQFNGHIAVSAATAPALTSCGTDPAIVGDDQAGEVTMGTGAPTGCVITFFVAYAAAPLCVVTWQATPLLSQSYAVSSTAITLTQTATSSDKVNYMCRARNGG